MVIDVVLELGEPPVPYDHMLYPAFMDLTYEPQDDPVPESEWFVAFGDFVRWALQNPHEEVVDLRSAPHVAHMPDLFQASHLVWLGRKSGEDPEVIAWALADCWEEYVEKWPKS